MKTIPKDEKTIQYLNDVFDVAYNDIVTNELMTRLRNQDGVVHLLTDCEIPPNHPYEAGGISKHPRMTYLIPFLQAFQRENDILFLFERPDTRKTHPCMIRCKECNIVFYNDRLFYFATPFDSAKHLETTIRMAEAGPSYGLIVKGYYVFSEWQDITESILRDILKDTIAIIATMLDGDAYLVYEFKF